MATYFVRKTGNDGSAGTSSGTAWATFGKALSTAATGDTVYIGAGVYREAITTAGLSAAASGNIKVFGDVDGAQTGDLGEVRLSGYTATKTAGASALITFVAKGFVDFHNITFVGCGAVSITSSGAWVGNVNFYDCTHVNLNFGCVAFITTLIGNANSVADRCIFVTAGVAYSVSAALNAGNTDYSIGCEVRNSLFYLLGSSATGVRLVQSSGSGTGKPGNLIARNNTILGGLAGVSAQGSNISTSLPMLAYNNVILGTATALSSGAASQITEDYNFIHAGAAARSNTTAGTHSVAAGNAAAVYEPLLEWGQAAQRGATTRQVGMPTIDSPLLNFGNDGGESITVDLLNRPRPSGGSVTWGSTQNSASPGTGVTTAVGALERNNTFTRETSTVHSGSNAISCVGPGYHDFQVPVDATTNTFSIYCQYDANYTGTKPQAFILANGEIGVAQQSVTATVGAQGSWEVETLPTITPTGSGIVTVRVQSNDTSGLSKVCFDSFNVG